MQHFGKELKWKFFSSQRECHMAKPHELSQEVSAFIYIIQRERERERDYKQMTINRIDDYKQIDRQTECVTVQR